MAQAIDTYVYKLMRGNEIVYFGTSKNPEQRENQHERNKRFDQLIIISDQMTKNDAEQEEERKLENFRRIHDKNPEYNMTCDG